MLAPRRPLPVLTAFVLLTLPLASAVRAQHLVQTARDAAAVDANEVWIASLGDSFSSGEGNPNNIGVPFNAWKWLDDERCNRSRWGWPYKIAERASNDFPNQVHLTFLACSGGKLKEGLLEPYNETPPGLGPVLRDAQLDRLEDLIQTVGRPPDAVLLTGGGNDIGFADVVKECFDSRLTGNCPGGKGTPGVQQRLARLEGPAGLYASVAGRLLEMGISPRRVVFLEYPNPLWGKKRKVTGGWGPEQILAACHLPASKEDWEWVHRNVVVPLQEVQASAARQLDWRLVDGYGEEFKKHAYCPREGLPGADSWWVGFLPQIVRQFGLGVFHPNRRGHEAMAEEAYEIVRKVLDEAPRPAPALFRAALRLPDGTAHFLRHQTYLPYDFSERRAGREGRIGTHAWRGLPAGVEAALLHPNGKAYFFEGARYHRFDFATGKVDKTARIGADGWWGLPTGLDAALLHPNGKAYFFRGTRYHRYDFSKRKQDKTGRIGVDGWRGLPGGLDGALMHPNGKAYFLRGRTYYRFDFETDVVDKIGRLGVDGWSGLGERLDAATLHPNRRAYFFEADAYHRFDSSRDRVDKTGQVGVDGWKGLEGPVDAAVRHPNGKTYFFVDDAYYRYDYEADRVDKRGRIGVDGWRGLSRKVQAALIHPNGKAYFFKGPFYYRYDFAKERVDKRGRTGEDGWKGLSGDLDSALLHSNGKAYFFRGETYYRYDFDERRVDKVGRVGTDGWKGL